MQDEQETRVGGDRVEREPGTLGVRPRGTISERTPGRRVALLVFLLSPLAVLAALCVLIMLSLRHEPAMVAPPVGAGAGETGMLNDYLTKQRQREREQAAEGAADVEGTPPDSAAAPGG